MTKCSLEDVRSFSREIQAYWGSHLYVRIVPEDAVCMDWYEILLSEQYVNWGKDHLKHVMLHEWGHRMISPISPHRSAIWQKVARKEGLTKQQAHTVVNIATDAWLDRAYLENPRWQDVYRSGLWESMESTAGQLYDAAQESNPAGSSALFRILIGLYRDILDKTANTAAKEVSGTKSQNCRFVYDSLTADQRAVIGHMKAILFENNLASEENIRRLARLLKPWLPDESTRKMVLLSRPHKSTRNIKNAGDVSVRIEAEARRAGLSDEEMEDIFGKQTMDRLRLQSQRLSMYARVVPVVKQLFQGRAQRAFSGYKKWRVGQPLAKMDVVATMQRSGQLIPGINTLAKNYARRGMQSDSGAGAVVIVLDDSGSTEGDVLMREKEAAFAVIAAAREFGDPVGLVVFGSEVTAARELTSRYVELEETICRLDSNSGGTELALAVKKGLQQLGDINEFALFLMTDAEITDTRQVMDLIHNLPLGARVIAFCFNEEEVIRETFGPMISRQFTVMQASTDKPFAETALEAIYG